jgi:hypothetical protein
VDTWQPLPKSKGENILQWFYKKVTKLSWYINNNNTNNKNYNNKNYNNNNNNYNNNNNNNSLFLKNAFQRTHIIKYKI